MGQATSPAARITRTGPTCRPSYSQSILSPYEGTRLGRQEIEGELLEEVPGTLWNCDMLDHCCIERAPDPGPGSSSDSSRSECSL